RPIMACYGSAAVRTLLLFPTRRSSDLPYRALIVAPRSEDLRRIGRGGRARPGKYDKTGRRAASQDGCMTLATIDSVVEPTGAPRSEEHTSALQSRFDPVCRLLLGK